MDALKITTIRAWIQRRRDKGQEPNADDIWNRIHRNWPTLSNERAEAIFQAADRSAKRYIASN